MGNAWRSSRATDMTLFKELQLWIPGKPDSRRAQFNFETRCTCALVERLLPRIETEGL